MLSREHWPDCGRGHLWLSWAEIWPGWEERGVRLVEGGGGWTSLG